MVLFDHDPFQIFQRALRHDAPRSTNARLGRAVTRRSTEAPATAAVNVSSGDEGTELTMLVPGFGPEHIDVSVERAALRIRGERDGRRFERSFRLPHAVHMEDARAEVEHGVLTLTLPRSEAERRQQVPVLGGAAALEGPAEIREDPGSTA